MSFHWFHNRRLEFKQSEAAFELGWSHSTLDSIGVWRTYVLKGQVKMPT